MFVARKSDVCIDHTLSEVWQQERNCILHVSVTANYGWRPRLVWPNDGVTVGATASFCRNGRNGFLEYR